jgi:hypothetical protein
MKDDILDIVDILLKLRLTANQFLFMFLKHKKKDEQLYRYLQDVKALTENEMYDLEERGFIVNINSKANEYWADRYLVTQKFVKELEQDSEYAEEFWGVYPGFCLINTSKAPLKGINKDDFLNKYTSFVKKDELLHKRIMKSLRYQKGKDELKIRIDKWFDSRTWESVEEEISIMNRKVYGQREL